MDKLLEVKKTVTALMAALSAFLGWMGWLVVLYAVSMGIDYLTGSALAAKTGDWQSKKAREGLWHMAGSSLTYTVLLCPVVLVWYILTEMGSIVENVGEMGAPVPAFLKNIIAALHTGVEESGDHLAGKK